MAAQQFFPISELSTYHPKWVIRARVTNKGQLRSFASKREANAQTQVFDCTLLDESGVEISASFFGGVADKYFPMIQQGKCYTFSRGSVRIANRQYNRCPHRYQLTFDNDALIEEAAEVADIKVVSYSFTDLHAVQARSLPCTVDLIGIVTAARPTAALTSKEGKELVKREITIADDTATSMTVTLWGERASKEDKAFEGHPVICLKGVALREWNGGRSGSLIESGVMEIKPTSPEAQRLQQWWSQHGSTASITSLSLSTRQEGLVDLKTLQSKAVPCTVDLCCIISSFKPTYAFTSQGGKELVKREITLVDDSACSMGVTLWGERAKQDDSVFANNALVLLQGVIVKEWNGGRSGSLLEAGSMTLQPSTPEAQRVRDWWAQGGSSQSVTALSSEIGAGAAARAAAKACTVSEMRSAAEQVSSAQPETFGVVCRLALVQMRKQGETQPLVYMACQEAKANSTLPCNKRLGEDGFCAACNRAGKAAPRMNLRCKFSDFSDAAWLTTFHEPAQSVLGTTAEDIKAMEAGEGGRDAVEATIRRQYFSQPMQVTVRAKLDSYNGEPRANVTCVDVRPVNRGVHGRAMLKSITEMLGSEPVLAC